MNARSRNYWLPVLIAFPLGLAVNLLSSTLDAPVVIALIAISSISLVIYLFWERIRNWRVEQNRQSRKREIERITEEITYINSLKNDTTKLISRVAWDSFRFLLVCAVVIISAISLPPLTSNTLVRFGNSSLVAIIFAGYFPLFGLFVISLFVRRFTYLRNLLDYEEFIVNRESRIKELSSIDNMDMLVIHRAIFGIEDKTVDVTTQIQMMVKENKIDWIVDNSLAADPAPGVVKTLKVEYMYQDKSGNIGEIIEIREGDHLTIPLT